MKDRTTVVNEKIDYSKDHHRLYWLNTILGDIENNIIGMPWCKKDRSATIFWGTGIQIQSQKYWEADDG